MVWESRTDKLVENKKRSRSRKRDENRIKVHIEIEVESWIGVQGW